MEAVPVDCLLMVSMGAGQMALTCFLEGWSAAAAGHGGHSLLSFVKRLQTRQYVKGENFGPFQ